MTGVPLSRHLGRTLPELLPQPVAHQLGEAVLRVFDAEAAGARAGAERSRAAKQGRPWTWLVSCVPGADHAEPRCGGRA